MTPAAWASKIAGTFGGATVALVLVQLHGTRTPPMSTLTVRSRTRGRRDSPAVGSRCDSERQSDGSSAPGPGFSRRGMSDYLERWFQTLGVAYERRTVSPGRDNLIARYESPRGRKTVLFDAHQDTVPTDGMTIPPFVPEIREGRLYGRGSCDVKGAWLPCSRRSHRLVKERPADSASVVMACTVDEEFTHTGSSQLAASPRMADYAIVAEPTRLEYYPPAQGAVRWKIRTKGVACHSSNPQAWGQCDLPDGTVAGSDRGLRQPPRSSHARPDPWTAEPLGRSGSKGVSVNVVPDWSEIEVDRRIIPGETLQLNASRRWIATSTNGWATR